MFQLGIRLRTDGIKTFGILYFGLVDMVAFAISPCFKKGEKEESYAY